MRLTQEEAGKWAKIKSKCMLCENNYYLMEQKCIFDGKITDFTVNPQCPTITMTYGKYGDSLIDANCVEEKL